MDVEFYRPHTFPGAVLDSTRRRLDVRTFVLVGIWWTFGAYAGSSDVVGHSLHLSSSGSFLVILPLPTTDTRC